jgi:hypothetical protein
LQALEANGRVKKVPRSDHRIHESIREGFLSSTRRQVIDQRDIPGSRERILAGQKIAPDHLHVRTLSVSVRDGLNPANVARRARKSAQVAEAAFQHPFQDGGANETGRPCDKDRIILPDYEIAVQSFDI